MDNLQKRIEGMANGIAEQLMRPENLDLLIAVRDHDLDGTQGGFMFSFQRGEPLDFDSFAHLTHQIDAFLVSVKPEHKVDYRSMSERYDEYLAECETRKTGLDSDQTKRFEALIAPFDDGWSGSVYGYIMRMVQRSLRSIFQN